MRKRMDSYQFTGLLGIAIALFVGCSGTDTDLVFGAAGPTGGPAGGTGTGGSGEDGGASSTSATSGSTEAAGTGGGAATGGGTGGSGGAACTETWFCDSDKDEHGDQNTSQKACEAPAGGDATCAGPYVASSDDCAPAAPNGHPGQTMFFNVPLPPPVYGELSFDYDCNGTEERDPAQLFKGGAADTCAFNDCFMFPAPSGFTADATCGGKTGFVACDQNFGQCKLTPKDAPEALRCR